MKHILHNLYWHYLKIRQRMLIPDAYFNENKRIKLCRIDEKIIKLKSRSNKGNG